MDVISALLKQQFLHQVIYCKVLEIKERALRAIF